MGVSKIRVAKLTLSNFRNFESAVLELSPGLTIFHGANGQGKSNLLEAVYLLSVARSPRVSTDRSLVNWNLMRSGGHAQAVVIAREREQTIKVQIDFEVTPSAGRPGPSSLRSRPGSAVSPGSPAIAGRGRGMETAESSRESGMETSERDRESGPASPSTLRQPQGSADGGSVSDVPGGALQKSLRVNGVVTTAAEFVGALNVVAFAAEDIELVTGAPGVRRRYLDILISQGDPAYLRTLQRYQRVVTQRNHLLRRVRERRSAEEELRFWDDRLAEEGAAIVERRHAAVERLAEHVERVHRALTGGGDSLGITYRPRLGPGQPPESYQSHLIADTLSQSIAALRERELSQGASIVGPHRDEFEITLGGFTAGTFASRGQSRTIALALKLAEAEFVSHATGRKPVLALDDVLSELDAERRLLVMETVADYDQVLLTTTDLDRVDAGFLTVADRWTVAAGTVSPVAA